MRRSLWYMLILAIALAIPQKGLDVEDLLPVELVSVRKEQGEMVIETDTGDLGRGNDLDAAFRNLEETAIGTVYLDTADYLLITDETKENLEELKAYLKEKTWVCEHNGKSDLPQVAAYLAAHKPNITLEECDDKTVLPKLLEEKGRIRLKNA